MTDYKGECCCGNIKFETHGDPLFTQHCHCEKCREIASQSQKAEDKIGYSYTAAYLTKHFKITEGEDKLETVLRGNSNLLLCNQCKSLIYGISRDPSLQAGIGINANNFQFQNDRPESFKPDKHIWYENRMVEIHDDLPKYKDAPKEQLGTGELMDPY